LGYNAGLIVAATMPYSGSVPMMLTSPDGTTLSWTKSWNPMPFEASHVKYLGGKWIAVGYSNLSGTSPDGLTWTAGTAAPIGMLSGSPAWNGSEYIVASADRNAVPTVYASTDGLTWSYREIMSKQTAAAINPTTGLMVSIGQTDTSRASTDGASWTFGPLAGNDLFMDVTWSPGLSAFVALIQSGANYYAATSTDGVTWTPNSYSATAYAPCGYVGSTVAASPTVLLNAGASLTGNCIATSANNVSTWNVGTSPMPAGTSATKSFWTGSVFVLLGSNGFIATSPDGVTWTVRTSGTTNTLRGGAVGKGGTLIVVGDSGTILTSSDGGTTWVPQSSGTAYSFNRVVWTGSQYYAAGGAANLMQSTDGVTWNPVISTYTSWLTTFPYPTPPDFNDLLWSATKNSLVVFGSDGLVGTVP
jgi:hypothetical protein